MEKNKIIRATVISGRQLGRTLGFPTANLGVCPVSGSEGVWLARVLLPAGQRHWALVNIGTRPSVSVEEECSVEAWLFDFSGDLYDQELSVELLKYLRPEEKFNTIDALRAAMKQDKKEALQIIKNHEFTL